MGLKGAGDGRQASLVLRLSLVFALVVQCLLSGVIYSLRERVAYIHSHMIIVHTTSTTMGWRICD